MRYGKPPSQPKQEMPGYSLGKLFDMEDIATQMLEYF